MKINEHTNSVFANQEVSWIQTDSYENYQKNLIANYKELEKFGWIDKTFTYKFNKYGFRCDEFETNSSSAMFIGCSHTFGVGLPVECTFPYLISSKLNFKNINLGVGGSANDTAFRLANFYIPRLKPSIVIFLSTEQTRFELFEENGQIEILNVWNKDYLKQNFFRNWIGNSVNTDMNFIKNQLAIKQLCIENNIKYCHKEFSFLQELDKARDLQHYGVQTHRFIAKKFLDTFN